MTSAESDKLSISIWKQNNNKRTRETDLVAVEEPLEIRLGYTDLRLGRQHKSVSITMRTPGHDSELALGFLFAEAIVDNPGQVKSIERRRENCIGVELQSQVRIDLSRLDRHFYTTSSCGVCGKASLEALSLQGAEVIETPLQIQDEHLYQLGRELHRHQQLFASTGGNHACALFDSEGDIILCREDVGRHNAMDKLIGHLFMENRLPLHNLGLIVSGRVSFELMQKALMARCPLLVAVGAPSSLAVELAEEYNITLIGFLGDNRFNIYHGADNIAIRA